MPLPLPRADIPRLRQAALVEGVATQGDGVRLAAEAHRLGRPSCGIGPTRRPASERHERTPFQRNDPLGCGCSRCFLMCAKTVSAFSRGRQVGIVAVLHQMILYHLLPLSTLKILKHNAGSFKYPIFTSLQP